MGLLDKFKKIGISEESEKINATSHKKIYDVDGDHSSNYWNDNVQLSMSDNIRYNRVNVNSASHRYHQTLENPYFFKMTFQIFKRILGKRGNRPYPFMYVKRIKSENNDKQTRDIQTNDSRDQRIVSENSQSKFNAINSSENNQRDKPVSDMGDVNGRTTEKEENNFKDGFNSNRSKYERRDDLNNKFHELWDKEGLWDIVINCLSFASGVNSCAILRTKGAKRENKYWVIPRNFFKKGYTKNRCLTKIDVEWSNWEGIEEENLGVPRNAIETYIIGNEFVLCTPFPSFDSPYGESYIQAFWQTGVYKEFLRLLQMMFYWKGGVISNHERIPNSMTDTDIEDMKKEYRKGMLSELQITKINPGVSPENIDKIYSHESIYATGMNFDVGNSILSEDSLFPKQYIEGEAESGALGGQSANINKEELDDSMFYYFYTAIEKLVKDVNRTFFNLQDDDYTIVPYQVEDHQLDKNGDGLINSEDLNSNTESEDNKSENENVGIKKEKKMNSLLIKNNEIKLNSSEIKNVYEGYILTPTSFQQDDNSYEFLDYDQIAEFYNDPKSVKEFYLSNEHPITDPMNLKKSEAIGRIELTGIDEKGVFGKLYTFEELEDDEIMLSPSYYSKDILRDGKIYHSQIDIKNIVKTTHPRSQDLKLQKKE
jgi:hypothetical protein